VDQRLVPIEILNFGAYEMAEWTVLRGLLEDRMTMFDIGANVGWYSMNLARAFPQARILAFEPIPATHSYLRKNLELNQIPNVQPGNFGFSDRAGELTFYYYPEGSGNASAADLTGTGAAQKLTCRVRTLDDFIAETGERVDFIKCDVEGAELFVLQGGAATLQRHKPIVFAEMLRKWAAKFGYHPNQIIEFMARLGYQCFTANGEHLRQFRTMDENTVETNFLFLHPERHAAKISRFLAPA
jgi:FkbM family methyltransferase